METAQLILNMMLHSTEQPNSGALALAIARAVTHHRRGGAVRIEWGYAIAGDLNDVMVNAEAVVRRDADADLGDIIVTRTVTDWRAAE